MNFSELYLKEGKGYSKSFLNTGKGQRSELELFFKVITHYELNSDTLILEYVTRPIKSYTRIEGVDRLMKEEPTEIKTVKWLVLEKNENYFKIQRAAISSGTEIIEYSRMTKPPGQPSQ